jgi:hypothetical protein
MGAIAMITLPKPIGPPAPVPDDAILLAFDLRIGAMYYQIGSTVWKLQGEQWTVYGSVTTWPKPMSKEAE